MNFSDMSADELEARRDELIAEARERRDGVDFSTREAEFDAVCAELEKRREQAAQNDKKRRKMTTSAARTTRTFKESEEKEMNIESAEYRSAWLKRLQGKELSEEERTAMSAGAAIPQATANLIKGKMEQYPLLSAVDVMHIPGTVVIPVEGTVADAGVVAMGTAATDSADTLGSISLSVYKIIKTVEITADVAAMSVDAFETWLVDRLSNKVFREVTKLIASGTGSSQPTGLVKIAATTLTATEGYDKILEIIAKVASQYLPGASFAMGRNTFFTKVLGLKDGNGRPIVVADPQAPAKYNILGYPAILEDELGAHVVFGDLKEGYVFNFAKDVEVDRDDSAGFRTGSTVFRGMALGDGKPTGVGLVHVASL